MKLLQLSLRDLFWLVVALASAIAYGDDAGRPSVRVGDDLVKSVANLRKAKAEVDNRVYAFTKMDDDVGYKTCVLDKERAFVVLFYSKSTGKITSLSAVVIPAQRHGKLDEIWTDANSFTIGERGAYSIEFSPTDTPPDK
jgi:hypothetical protein